MKRSLLLSGFMATGKSTVGEMVGRLSGAPFVCLDTEIERVAGKPIDAIFRGDGEPAFRQLEATSLRKMLDDPTPSVVALGGGALTRRELRLDALDRAVVATLDASVESILSRAGTGTARPLLNVADPRARIEELLEARRIAYAEAHGRFDTDHQSPADLSRQLLKFWGRDPVAVAVGERSYRVEIGAGFAAQQLVDAVGDTPVTVLVTDENVASHHGHTIREALEATRTRVVEVVLKPGEINKRLATVERIWTEAQAAGADRSSLFLGFGGGVVTDMAGFAASGWMRGVRWVVLPTTLLAMADAAVGGKTGVDLGEGKNAVGAFWQPSRVVCDVDFLGTEPHRGFRGALAEVLKTGLIGDPELVEMVRKTGQDAAPAQLVEMVRRCIRVKARVVSADEREGGSRALLNLGHTIGHSLEASGGYERWTHGEAVSLGLVAAMKVGVNLGHTSAELSALVTDILRDAGLPVTLDAVELQAAADVIALDKKRTAGEIRFVAVHDVGDVRVHRIPLAELQARVRDLA